jgi:hypothetical protein
MNNAQNEIKMPEPEPQRIGDIWESTWGYDQTNADFYQVVKVTAKTVTLQQVGTVDKHDSRTYTGHSVPDTSKHKGEPFRRTVKTVFGNPGVSINSYAFAEPWDGKPIATSSYG